MEKNDQASKLTYFYLVTNCRVENADLVSLKKKPQIIWIFTGIFVSYLKNYQLFTGPAITKVENVSMRNFVHHDFVPAIKLISWPSIAQDWTRRSRPGDWPSVKVLEECVSADCHIVPVAHKESPKHIKKKEWRLSFSGAEIVLAKTLTCEQRQAVIVSKMILKLALKEVLEHKPSLKNCKSVSSYELKSSFYWLRERKNAWGNLTDDIREVIENFIEFLHQGALPDYFIPKKNIIENVTSDMVEELSAVLKQVFTKQGMTQFLEKCYWYCYQTQLEEYDSLDGSSLKCLYSELKDFCENETPSIKLSLFSITHHLLGLFTRAIDGTGSDIRAVEITPVLFDIRCIQEGLTKKNSQNEVIHMNQLEDLFHDNKSFSFEMLSDFSDFVFDVLSQEVVQNILGESIWSVVAFLLARPCITAGLQHGLKQEVLDFADLLEANPKNTTLREAAVEVHGSMEEFQSAVALASENADSVYEFYEGLCQDTLQFYFDVCARFLVGEEFHCEEERIAVFGVQSMVRDIPEILDDEMLGTPELRQRVRTLMEKCGTFHCKEF